MWKLLVGVCYDKFDGDYKVYVILVNVFVFIMMQFYQMNILVWSKCVVVFFQLIEILFFYFLVVILFNILGDIYLFSVVNQDILFEKFINFEFGGQIDLVDGWLMM